MEIALVVTGRPGKIESLREGQSVCVGSVSSLKCHHYRAHHRLHGKCLMVACRKRCRFIILITPFATVPNLAISLGTCVSTHGEKNMTELRYDRL